jgi:UDP-N-acetylmuramoyl-tripeptide--D-alanyl-D-alanine ligase
MSVGAVPSARRPVLWRGADAEAAVNARAVGPAWAATGIALSAAEVRPGDLFVALRSPCGTADGHASTASAFAAGAVAALVERRPAGIPSDAPLLLVEDSLAALDDLARVARLRSRARVAAVAGSLGKSTVRDALARALALVGPAHDGGAAASWPDLLAGLASLPEDAAHAVFELGSGDPSRVAAAAQRVRPDIAVVTNADPVHLDRVSSPEALADAWAGVFGALPPSGVAVVNRDDAQFARLLAAARTSGLSRILCFGTAEEADARAVECSVHATCSAVTAQVGRERVQYCLSLPGRRHVANSLACVLALRAFGQDAALAARVFSSLSLPAGRGRRRRIRLAHGAVTLLDVSGHAAPASASAALNMLGRSDPGAGGRRIAVLGDMHGLGSRSAQFHAALAADLRATGIDIVFSCGQEMRHLYDRLPAHQRGRHAPDARALAPAAAAAMRAGDVVLVMGSPEAGMSVVVEALDALGADMLCVNGACMNETAHGVPPLSPALDAARG